MAQYQFQEKEKQVVPRTTMQHRCIIRAEQYCQGATRGLNRQLLHDGAIRRATVSAVASPRPQGRSSTSQQQRGTLTYFAHYAGGITLAPGVTCLILAGTSASTFPNAQPSPPSTICWNLGLLHTSSR
jgi:hypothetical protein